MRPGWTASSGSSTPDDLLVNLHNVFVQLNRKDTTVGIQAALAAKESVESIMQRACIKTLVNLMKHADLKRHLKDRKAWPAAQCILCTLHACQALRSFRCLFRLAYFSKLASVLMHARRMTDSTDSLAARAAWMLPLQMPCAASAPHRCPRLHRARLSDLEQRGPDDQHVP